MSLIQCNNVFYKTDDREIIKNLTLSINKGESISIIGKSGCGKTTLLKILSLLLSPSSGYLLYNDKPYSSYNPVLLRRLISYCPQLPYLFGAKVIDNFLFPFSIRKEKVNYERINELLYKLKLDSSFLEKDINSLSGGEKQRIALIRSIIFTPNILLLDEITASLDEENKTNVLSFIKELNDNGTTIISITHDNFESKTIYNRRLTIDSGSIIKEEIL